MSEEPTSKLTLVSEYNSEIESEDQLREYCYYNIYEDVIYDYLDSEYGYIDVGCESFEASDIVRNCGDIYDFKGEYLDNVFEDFSWEELDDYDDGDTIEMCGIVFTVKKTVEETEEEKAEREKREAEEKIIEEKTKFEYLMRSFVGNIPTNYPHCADLGYIIPIVCSALTEAIEEKKKIESLTLQEASDELSKPQEDA